MPAFNLKSEIKNLKCPSLRLDHRSSMPAFNLKSEIKNLKCPVSASIIARRCLPSI